MADGNGLQADATDLLWLAVKKVPSDGLEPVTKILATAKVEINLTRDIVVDKRRRYHGNQASEDQDRPTLLHEACSLRTAGHDNYLDSGLVHLLLTLGADVLATDSRGRTPLMLAAAHCDHNAIRALIQSEHCLAADERLKTKGLSTSYVNLRDDDLNSALTHLCLATDRYWSVGSEDQENCLQVVQALIDAGADVDSCNTDQDMPAHCISYVIVAPWIEKLLESLYRPGCAWIALAGGQYKRTCLQLAAEFGNEGAIKWLASRMPFASKLWRDSLMEETAWEAAVHCPVFRRKPAMAAITHDASKPSDLLHIRWRDDLPWRTTAVTVYANMVNMKVRESFALC
jgi:hypothetical protein